jgi:hypothetical protein
MNMCPQSAQVSRKSDNDLRCPTSCSYQCVVPPVNNALVIGAGRTARLWMADDDRDPCSGGSAIPERYNANRTIGVRENACELDDAILHTRQLSNSHDSGTAACTQHPAPRSVIARLIGQRPRQQSYYELRFHRDSVKRAGEYEGNLTRIKPVCATCATTPGIE